MNRFFFKAALPAVALALALGAKALATPINGGISFKGTATLNALLPAATSATAFNNFKVDLTTGDFSGIATDTVVGTSVGAPDWVFGVNSGGSFTDLWNVGGFQYNLTSSTVDLRTSSVLVVTGTGMVTSSNPSLDPTIGTWYFTANAPAAGSPGAYQFSFSSGTEVPDGGTTAMLLGLGLTGLAMLARWRKLA